MLKAETLDHWRGIEPDQVIAITPVEYKHTGSTYAEDGIRLTGSPEFIDSILSRLKDLLEYESDTTRLQLVYKQSQDRETQQPIAGYNCYIQVHERGGEAIIMNGIMSRVKERQAAREEATA